MTDGSPCRNIDSWVRANMASRGTVIVNRRPWLHHAVRLGGLAALRLPLPIGFENAVVDHTDRILTDPETTR